MVEVRHASFGLLFCLCASIVACGGPDQVVVESAPWLPSLDTPNLTEGGDVLLRQGDIRELRDALAESVASERVVQYLSAELDLLEGEFTRAFDRFADVVVSEPNTTLGALAAARAAALAQLVTELDERAGTVLGQLSGQQLHPLTAIWVNRLALEGAWSDFQLVRVEEAHPFSAAALGMPNEWRAAGPMSRLPRLGLDQPTPADADQILAERYDPDGRRVRTRLLLADELSWTPALTTQGTYVLETWAHLSTAEERLLVLESRNGTRVFIDDELVLERPDVGDYRPELMARPVAMGAGWHRLRLHVGWKGESELSVRLVPLAAQPGEIRFQATPPEGVTPAAATALGRIEPLLPAVLADEILAPVGALQAYVLLRLAGETGNGPLGDRALQVLDGLGPRSPLTWVAAASLASVQFDLSPAVRHNRRLQGLREAIDRAPSANGAALPLVALLASDGREDEALRLANALGDRLSHEPAYWLALYDLYERRSWDELTEMALERALLLEPEACFVVSRLLDLYTYRDHYPASSSLTTGFQRCEDGLIYQVDYELLPAGQLDEAVEVLRLLVDRQPDADYLRRRLFDLLMVSDRRDEARALVDESRRYGLDPTEAALLTVDWLLASGRADEALALVQGTLAGDSPGSYALLRAAAQLEGEPLLAELRRDTLAAIEHYRTQEYEPRAAAVYALDYGAYRYFPGGAGVQLTHQIIHVRTRDALGNYGEVSVPRQALLLRARTIKADGTILEPDNLVGKETISMPNLEVGDFIEYEYLEVVGPSRVRDDALIGGRFYFQVFDAPLAHSEMVVDVPEGWSELVVDQRAGAPDPTITNRDGFRRYSWVVQGSQTPVEEVGSPDATEILPSARYAHAYEWADVRDRYADQRAAVVRVTPELTRAAREIVAGADGDRDAVHRLFRFVVDEIEETGGFMSGEAAWTWRQGEGERLPLLLALLEGAGYEPELVFLKSWSGDWEHSPIPDPDEYPHTVVRVPLGDDEDDAVWLQPDREYAPFNYIGPAIQGTRGLVIGDRAGGPVRWLESPVWPDETNHQQIELTLTVEASGDFVGEATEIVPERSAAETRSYLEQIQDQRTLIQDLESGLSASFAGVVVDDIRIDNVDDPDARLVLHYTFRGQSLADIDPSRLAIDTRILDRRLLGTLGATAERSLPLVVDFPFLETLRLNIVVPDLYVITERPEESAVDHPVLSQRWTVTPGDSPHAITVERRTRLSVGRVAPDEYAAFLGALRQIDQAESLHIVGRR